MTPRKPPKRKPANARYRAWRERHPDLYRKRQRLLMRKRRAAAKLASKP